MSAIPEWLKLPLINVKMATVGEVPTELRTKADDQLLEAIAIRCDMAREEGRKQGRRERTR